MKAIDFFCGGGGMTYGLRQSGINVIAGIDLDSSAKETYEFNNPGAVFINQDITKLELDYFEKRFEIKKNDDEMIFVGCSPCQYYSIIRSSKEKSKKTKDLLLRFTEFIQYYKPAYVLVENVPGIISNKETVLFDFLNKLATLGYGTPNSAQCQYGIVNMRDYGIAQNRKRFSLIATRLQKEVHLPQKELIERTLSDVIGEANGFDHIAAGFNDSDTERFHSAMKLSQKNIERLRLTPHNGGNRLAWKDNKKLQLKCYVNKDSSFCDVYGRMSWDKPSPTITTKFLSLSNGRFGHPEEDRALSVREGATIQSFPQNFVFKTDSLVVASKLIGNAVPPEYARRIGEMINEQ